MSPLSKDKTGHGLLNLNEALSARDSNPADQFTNFYQEVLAARCQGEFDYEATLNQKFPEIVPTKSDEFLNK